MSNKVKEYVVSSWNSMQMRNRRINYLSKNNKRSFFSENYVTFIVYIIFAIVIYTMLADIKQQWAIIGVIAVTLCFSFFIIFNIIGRKRHRDKYDMLISDTKTFDLNIPEPTEEPFKKFLLNQKNNIINKFDVRSIDDYKLLEDHFNRNYVKYFFSIFIYFLACIGLFMLFNIKYMPVVVFFFISIFGLFIFIALYKDVYEKAMEEVYINMFNQEVFDNIKEIEDHSFYDSINPELIFKYINLNKLKNRKIDINNYILFNISNTTAEHCNLSVTYSYRRGSGKNSRTIYVTLFGGSILLIKKQFNTDIRFCMFTNFYNSLDFDCLDMRTVDVFDNDVNIYTNSPSTPFNANKAMQFLKNMDYYIYAESDYILVAVTKKLFFTKNDFASYETNKSNYNEDMIFVEDLINILDSN